MTDEEFELLVSVARIPAEHRKGVLLANLNPWTASAITSGVADLLMGRKNVRGTAITAWHKLVVRAADA